MSSGIRSKKVLSGEVVAFFRPPPAPLTRRSMVAQASSVSCTALDTDSGLVTTGMETSEPLLNVSVRLANALSTSKTVDVQLNITNSSGAVVNSTTTSSVVVGADSIYVVNVTDIPTSAWNEDDYIIVAYVTGDVIDNRTEGFTFKNVTKQGNR